MGGREGGFYQYLKGCVVRIGNIWCVDSEVSSLTCQCESERVRHLWSSVRSD